MEHPEEIRATATSGIAHSYCSECFQHGFWVAKARRVALLHELLDVVRRFTRNTRGKVALEGLTAHERDYRLRRVVTAGLVASRHELLEYLAQHFGVDGNFDLEGSIFTDSEVVVKQKSSEEPLKRPIRESKGLLVV